MSTYKKAPQGIVAQQFDSASISAVSVGDLVQISGNMEVAVATTGKAIGEVVAKDTFNEKVTVELFAAKILNLTVGASAVTAGDLVKMSAKNTVIPAGLAASGDFTGALTSGALTGTVTNLAITEGAITAALHSGAVADSAVTDLTVDVTLGADTLTSGAVTGTVTNLAVTGTVAGMDQGTVFGLALEGGATGATIRVVPL